MTHIEWKPMMPKGRGISRSLLMRLQKEHGSATLFAKVEGGKYVLIPPLGKWAIASELLKAKPHMIRFHDGREWDEVNGLRPVFDSQE